MNWFNEPSRWSEDEGSIVAFADAQTDFLATDGLRVHPRQCAHLWRVNSDGLRPLGACEGELCAAIRPAGAAVRVDESHWIKTGVEMFEGTLRFSAVVTIDHSNWVVADLPQSFNYLNFETRAQA